MTPSVGNELDRERASGPASSDPGYVGPAEPVRAVLHQLAHLLDAMTDQQYAATPDDRVPGTVGGHIRHCLDHLRAFLSGRSSGFIDYDNRERGTPVEQYRRAGLDVIRQCEADLASLNSDDMDQPVEVSAMLASSDAPVRVRSTMGRELVFVLSHTIHHNAIIGTLAKVMGIEVPQRFGYAPSTIAYLDRH